MQKVVYMAPKNMFPTMFLHVLSWKLTYTVIRCRKDYKTEMIIMGFYFAVIDCPVIDILDNDSDYIHITSANGF